MTLRACLAVSLVLMCAPDVALAQQGKADLGVSLRAPHPVPADFGELLQRRVRRTSLVGTGAWAMGLALSGAAIALVRGPGPQGPFELRAALGVSGFTLGVGGLAVIIGAQLHRRRSEMAFGLREPVPWRRTRRLRGIGWVLFITGYASHMALMIQLFAQGPSRGRLVAWGVSITGGATGFSMTVAGRAMRWGALRKLRITPDFSAGGPGLRVVF